MESGAVEHQWRVVGVVDGKTHHPADHQVVITQTRDVSPGLVRNVLKAIEASKKEDQGS